MNSTLIFGVIDKIAKTPGKNDKQAILETAMKDEQFADVIVRALNPFITYGIAKRFPVVPNGTNAEFDSSTLDLLNDLASRGLSGNAAKEALGEHLARLNEHSHELLWRIVLKDLRAGFGDSSVNKVAKGTLPVFPYQRCCLPKDAKLKEWDWSGGVISQEKADGMYCNINKDQGSVITMTTRQGNPLPVEKFPEIEWEIQNTFLPDTQSHGEILVEVDGVVAKRAIGNGIINRVLDGGDFLPNERPVFRVWDQIPLSSVAPKCKINHAYSSRLQVLLKQLQALLPMHKPSEVTPLFYTGKAVQLIETRIVHSIKEAYAHYLEVLRRKGEGTIVKKKTAIWKDGTSKEQVKLKLEAPCELEVFGWNDGEGKNADMFGSLKCRTCDHLLEVNVSGFSDALRREIWENIDEWTGNGKGGAIITVISNEILLPSASNPLHSLFLPRFEERRHDKDHADSLERVFAQFEAAIKKLEDIE